MKPTALVVLWSAALVMLGLAGAGCQALGVAASKLPPPTVTPAYEGLTNQTVAVVVWPSPEVEVDYPRLALQVGKRVEQNLKDARDKGGRGAKEQLAGLTFPYPVESFIGYFKERPSLAMMPTAELAPLLGAKRVIYIEIDRFTTRGGAAQGLVRGVADVNLSVFEVPDPVETPEEATTAQQQPVEPATEVYRESAIRIIFPPKGPEEGSNTMSEQRAYQGLVMAIADQLSKRFVPHSAEE